MWFTTTTKTLFLMDLHPLAKLTQAVRKFSIIKHLKRQMFLTELVGAMIKARSIIFSELADKIDREVLPSSIERRMPPKGSGLGEKDLNILKLWIAQGAEVELGENTAPGKEPLEGVWTNKSGKKIKAALLGVEEDKAILRMANGKIYKYPITSLNNESQKKVRDFAAKAE